MEDVEHDTQCRIEFLAILGATRSLHIILIRQLSRISSSPLPFYLYTHSGSEFWHLNWFELPYISSYFARLLGHTEQRSVNDLAPYSIVGICNASTSRKWSSWPKDRYQEMIWCIEEFSRSLSCGARTDCSWTHWISLLRNLCLVEYEWDRWAYQRAIDIFLCLQRL